MKRLLLSALLATAFSMAVQAQSKNDLEQAKFLRAEFIKATQEYKASLAKLVVLYEQDVKKAEQKVAVSEKLLREGLIAKSQVAENEQAVEAAKEKLAKTKQQQEDADKQIAALPSDEELAKEFAKSRQRARKSKRCGSWDLVARQRVTAKTVTVSYTFTCR